MVKSTLIPQQAGTTIQEIDATGLTDGSFVVVWNQIDNNGLELYAQHFDANGNVIANPVLIYSLKGNEFNAISPTISVSSNQNGNVLISWTNTNDLTQAPSTIISQSFNQNLVATGSPITIAQNQNNAAIFHAHLTEMSDNSFVIVWDTSDSSGISVLAQQFDATGKAITKPVTVVRQNGQGSNVFSQIASVSSNQSGNIIVAWTQGANTTSVPDTIFFQSYDSNLSPIGSPISLVSDSSLQILNLDVAEESDGSFIAIWNELNGQSKQVISQHFSPDGKALTPELNLDSQNGMGFAISGYSSTVALSGSTPAYIWGVSPNTQSIPNMVVFDKNSIFTQNAITDQSIKQGTAFDFAIPSNTFADTNADQRFTYSATLANGNALPKWLTFNAATGTFSGTPTTSDISSLTIQVTATDSTGAKANDDFNLNVIAVNNNQPLTVINSKGFGSQQWVAKNTSLPYTINFSNNALQGTNPVAQVTIAEQLDPNLDLSTFQLSNFGFEGNTYVVPTGLQNYTTQIDLTFTKGILVNVAAGLNTTTGTVTWTFTSIDPTTGQPITDPTKGFLPPEDQTGAGSGYVGYTIQPKANLTDGTVINAQASVTFDSQPASQTPPIFNTIEENPPSSYVNPLPTTETNPNFTVSWTGSDADSGIASYNIYVSTNGGKYTLWQNNTTATSATYNGQTGNTYSFYSVATDNLGLTEAAHAKADTTTTVNQVSSLSLGIKNTLDQSNYFGSLLFNQLSNLSNTVSEVGVFATDDNGDISNPNGSSTPLLPGQTGYTQAVLSESEILYGFDPNSFRSNTYSSQNQLFTNQLANFGTQLANGNTLNSLGFYVVVNGTANQELAALNGQISHQPNVFFNIIGANSNNLNPLQVIPSTTQTGQYNLAWNGSLGNGSSFTGNLLSINTTPLNNTTDLKQGIVHPIIDTTNGSALQVNFNVTSDAAFNDFVGFYQIASTDGTLENGLKPGQAGYAKAAVSEVISSLEFDQQIGTVTHSAAVYNPVDQPWQSTLTDTFAAGKLYAPVLIANGNVQSFLANNPNNNAPSDLGFASVGANPIAYFSFVNANSDGIDHIESLPGYTLGFKDYYGGGDLDYNDVVLHFNPATSSQIISSHAPTY